MNRRCTIGILILGLVLWALALLIKSRSLLLDVNAQGLSTAPERISAPDSTPQSVLYQGYVAIANEAYDGDGYFKFAVTNSDGSVFYWSNDGTSGEPTLSVPIEVLGGYFTVLLGDTSLTGMTQALGSGVFHSSGRYLKVWFSSSVSGPFDPLDPVPIAAAPYALNADTLDGYQPSDIASTSAYAGGDQSLNLDLPDTVARFVTIIAPDRGA